MRGRGLDEDTNLMVLWDGKPGSKGGTGETVKLEGKISNELIIIDAMKVLESVSTEQNKQEVHWRD